MQKISWKHDERMRHILTSLMGLGFEPEQIADIMATTASSVKGASQTYTKGFKAARHAANLHHTNEWPRYRVQALEQLIADGLPFRQIAKSMNCSQGSLRYAIDKYTDGVRVIRHRAGLPLAISEP